MSDFRKRENWAGNVKPDVTEVLLQAGAPATSRARRLGIEAIHDGKLASAVNAEVLMATVMFAQAKGLGGLELQLMMAKDDYASKVGDAIKGIDGQQAAQQLQKDLAAQFARGR